jgi:hypothetical protein
VTLVTDRAYQSFKTGQKNIDKTDLLFTEDLKGARQLERTVTVPFGSSWFVIENQANQPAEIHLECFPGARS